MEGVFGKIPILPQKIFLEWASKIKTGGGGLETHLPLILPVNKK
jgi:hypothetical protein